MLTKTVHHIILGLFALALVVGSLAPRQRVEAQTQVHFQGQIAYTASDHNIWVTRPGLDRPLQLTRDGTSENPNIVLEFSPDGEQFSYCKSGMYFPRGALHIYRLTALSGESTGVESCDAHWSPDGKQLVYASNGLYVYDVETRQSSELVAPFGEQGLKKPHWSPDGQWLSFYQAGLDGSTTGDVLWTLNLQTGERYAWKNVTGGMAWSSNSLQVVYESFSSTANAGAQGSSLRIALPHGQYVRQLYAAPQTTTTYPLWSPDGAQIAFVETNIDMGLASVKVADLLGKTRTAIQGRITLLAWSPNSTQLLVTVYNNATETNEIHIVDLGTGVSFQVAEGTTAIWGTNPASLPELTSPIVYSNCPSPRPWVCQSTPGTAAVYSTTPNPYDDAQLAQASLEELLARGPNTAEVYYAIGGHYLQQEHWIEAAEAFNQAINLNGPNQCLLAGLGIAHFRLRSYDTVPAIYYYSLPFDSNEWSCPEMIEKSRAVYMEYLQYAQEEGLNRIYTVDQMLIDAGRQSELSKVAYVEPCASIPSDPLKQYLQANGAFQSCIDLQEGLKMRFWTGHLGQPRLDWLWIQRAGYVQEARSLERYGDLAAALYYYEKALGVADQLNKQWIAVVARGGAEPFRKAVPNRQNPLGYFLVVEDLVAQAEVLSDMGRIYLYLDQPELALDFLSQAEDVANQAQAAALNFGGQWMPPGGWVADQLIPTLRYIQAQKKILLGDYESAVADLAAAVDSSSYYGTFQITYHMVTQVPRTDNVPGTTRARSLLEMGLIFLSRQELELAQTYLMQSLEAYQIGMPPVMYWEGFWDPLSLISLFNALGYVATQQNQPLLAINSYQQALSSARSNNDATLESEALAGLAAAQEIAGNPAAALAYYLEAITIRERIAEKLGYEQFKYAYNADSAHLYQRAIVLLMAAGREADAFELSERSRARAFLDSLNNTPDAAAASPTVSGFRVQQQVLIEELAGLKRALAAEKSRPPVQQNAQTLADLQQRIDAGQNRYNSLAAHMAVINRAYTSLVKAQTQSLAEFQARLGADATVVSYYLADPQAYAFVVKRDAFVAIRLPASSEQIRQAVSDFRELSFVDPTLSDTQPQALVQLYDWLLRPLETYLTTPYLGVVPHDVLHYLPFAALSNGKTVLVDRFRLFELPSTSTYAYVVERRKGSPTSVLAFGYNRPPGLPPLNFAEVEAQAVARIFNATPYVGVQASEANFRQQVSQAQAVLISAHGELNAGYPNFSRLWLAGDGGDSAEDGSLEVQEIYALDLSQARIVVLSACQTSLGKLTAGDEIIGLNRAFMAAGAPSVVTSLWQVDDQATQQLIQAFFAHLGKGQTAAEALRSAQRGIRQVYPHPYYWAGFVLSGDGGATVPEGNAGMLAANPVPVLTQAAQPAGARPLGTTNALAVLGISLGAVGTYFSLARYVGSKRRWWTRESAAVESGAAATIVGRRSWMITLLIPVLGCGTGWMAGKALSGLAEAPAVEWIGCILGISGLQALVRWKQVPQAVDWLMAGLVSSAAGWLAGRVVGSNALLLGLAGVGSVVGGVLGWILFGCFQADLHFRQASPVARMGLYSVAVTSRILAISGGIILGDVTGMYSLLNVAVFALYWPEVMLMGEELTNLVFGYAAIKRSLAGTHRWNGWLFYLEWVLLSSIGVWVGVGLWALLNRVSNETLPIDVIGMWAVVAVGPGLLQAWLLRKTAGWGYQWLLPVIASGAATMFIYALVSKVYLTGVGDVGGVLAGLAGWVCLWTTQWLVLRKKLGWGGWWAAANLVGYTAALIASAYLAEAVEPHLELFTRNKQTIQVVSRTLMWVLVLTGNALLTGWIVPRLLMKHWLKAQPAVAPQSDPLVEPSVMEERITE